MTQTLAVPIVLLGLACQTKPAEPTPSAPAAPAAVSPAPAARDAPSAPAAERVEDPSFVLNLTATGSYSAGKLGSFAVNLEPRGKYHINLEFPMTVKVKGGDALAFPKADLELGDVAELTEQRARFDVPFTPSTAGEHRVSCEVSFAVCTPENCVPETRTLALALAVQ